MSDRERDTIPPPSLGRVVIPSLASLARDEPGEGATDRAHALYLARVARALADRAITITFPSAVWIVLALMGANAAVGIIYKIWQMGSGVRP